MMLQKGGHASDKFKENFAKSNVMQLSLNDEIFRYMASPE